MPGFLLDSFDLVSNRAKDRVTLRFRLDPSFWSHEGGAAGTCPERC